MAAAFSITKCHGCGQLNRHPDDPGKSGTFTCGKCGKPLLSVVNAKPGKPSGGGWGPLSVLAIVIVAGVIYAWTENQKRAQPASIASVAKENTVAPAKQMPPTVTMAKPIAAPTAAPLPPMVLNPQNATPSRPPPPPQSLDISPADLARNRAAKPSAPAIAAQPAGEQPSVTAVPAKELKVVPAPPTGALQSGLGRGAIAPFRIITDSGSNYFVKLVNVARPRDQIVIFVRGGETYETKMPLGEYKFRGATGLSWYGRTDLFGPDTRFFGLRAKNGRVASETLVLRFSRDGRRISGHSITLKPVLEGNLEQEAMSRSEFEAD